jgi:hypothetical protein
MAMSRRHQSLGIALAALLVSAFAAACGGNDRSSPDTTGAAPSSPPSTPEVSQSPSAATTADSTKQLDSIVVLGHSGTTGYNSDPTQPDTDVLENSWATGTNPKVNSIYRRLLATHPALQGHTTSLGVDGSTVDDLAAQVDTMLGLDPMPDVVIIQTIDNDMQCDGTDRANAKTFGHTLSQALTTIFDRDRYAQVFLVDQPVAEKNWVVAVQGLSQDVGEASGTGPCDTYTAQGKLRPAGVRSYQRIVDAYFAQIVAVCGRFPRCYTDHAALQDMPFHEADATSDGNHFRVPALARQARYAWDALPAAIKNRS